MISNDLGSNGLRSGDGIGEFMRFTSDGPELSLAWSMSDLSGDHRDENIGVHSAIAARADGLMVEPERQDS